MRRCLLVALVVCLVGCTPATSKVSWDEWLDATASLYESVSVAENTDGSIVAVGADDLAAIDVTGMYLRARAVAGLGPTAPEILGESGWKTVLKRVNDAATDMTTMESSFAWAPPAYVAYEIGWADQVTQMLTDDQRTLLRQMFFGGTPLAGVDPEQADVIDVYMAVWAWILFGGQPGSVNQDLRGILDPYRTLCDLEQDNPDWTYGLFLIAFPPGVYTPCSSEQRQQLWENAAEYLSEDVDADDGGASFFLLLLEQARVSHFQDSETYRENVNSMFTILRDSLGDSDPRIATEQLAPLQATAHLLGESFVPPPEQVEILSEVAIEGGLPTLEYFTGPSLSFPLYDGRILGSPIDIPETVYDEADPVEYLSLLLGQGQKLTSEDTALFAKINDIDFGEDFHALSGVIDIVSSLMLTSDNPEIQCSESGFAVLDSALGASETDLDPTSIAIANRLFDTCEREIPQERIDRVDEWSGNLTDQSLSELSLVDLWALARIQCATQPDQAQVGPSQWPLISALVRSEGGVMSETGFISLRGTHFALQIMTTTTEECQATGVMTS
ncbi:MAG: hypothetical protein FWG08_03410 [Propionibacteriaceae bacterium]|nr:hypothetical protein [Propionibacteriaceae bacterium]